MKKLFTTLFLASLFLVGYGQDAWCEFNFDNVLGGCDNDYLWRDTINDSINIWQIGAPQKTIFNSAYSGNNAILTDTLNAYPINDTSSFTIFHMVGGGFQFPPVSIGGQYKIDSDSLLDYGKIEVSFDTGQIWIDLLNDTFYESYIGVYPSTLSFSGNSNGWKSFNFDITQLGSFFNVWWGSSILYRFTFITDSIQTNREGWILDNILLLDYTQNISENSLTTFTSTLYPNPATNSATIDFENPTNANFSLHFFDITGRAVIEQNIKTNRTQLNTQHLPPGIYQYRLISEKERRQSFGKFVVE